MKTQQHDYHLVNPSPMPVLTFFHQMNPSCEHLET